ncbi:preprotein translocase subunit SecE [Candidatus Uhrbacteria bacterium CG10_big_fil_rev_8_21_14_0_10_48_11]|uniref:Protein translocase subunit SecE n=1 Tax=Candidatus Uhrbacteria bacterium CG10_big_fil_rev_8_21_14_0_10_48_11 TaxID=1975037 RepID=A0A2M8LDW8_9BACT|nr:MAG: preprotein translocase subunit SecE [Candidatus Uhrbacteria bacterium CG10_big_fil_rev_8_21_14_0_10_48_11]
MTLTNNPIANYLKTSYEELKKVTWPTRVEATKHSLWVIALSLLVAAFFGIIDFFLSRGLELLLR